jgi:hypothetical protein
MSVFASVGQKRELEEADSPLSFSDFRDVSHPDVKRSVACHICIPSHGW